MKKRLFIIISIFIILPLAAFFGWKFFFNKQSAVIILQNPVIEIMTDSEREAEKNNQEIIPDNQLSTIENQQLANDSQLVGAKNKIEEKVIEKKRDVIDRDVNSSTAKIINKPISWGFQKATNRKIDTLIIHSSYDALGKDPYDVEGVIAEYKQYEVSAHYLIARNGKIYRLVEDKNIAWHAGTSQMPDGRTNVNAFSIGIEMINTENEKFTEAQYSALNSLIAMLKKEYSIKNILGHNDIAPGRKTDPWNIDWGKVNR